MKIRNGGIRPGVWCELRRAGRGDVDMPDVHDDSAAADDEPRPTAAAVDAAAPFTNTCKGWNRVEPGWNPAAHMERNWAI